VKVSFSPDKDQANLLDFKVTIAAADVDAAVKAAYREGAQVRIPGFRPGKAPRPVLNNVYGGKEYFLAKATDAVINESAGRAVDEQGFEPIDQAKFENVDKLVEEGKDFSYEFKVEVTPQVELSSYDPVQVELPDVKADKEQIDEEVDRLRGYYATYDEPAEEGGERVRHLPELTDQWVKDTLEFEGVDELRERLAESIERQNEATQPALKENQAILALGERVASEPPQKLVSAKETSLFQDLYRMLNNNHITYDAYLAQIKKTAEEYKETIHRQAVDQVKEELALDAVARHLKLEASKDELVEEFRKAGSEDPEKTYQDWAKAGHLSEIKNGILRMKASKAVVDGAEVYGIGEAPALKAKGKAAPKAAGAKKTSAAKGAPKAGDKPAAKKTAAKKTTKAAAPKKPAASE
jgi:FKBP-type peptidyl-prolyl cis-trans isomerase (trigger factor)